MTDVWKQNFKRLSGVCQRMKENNTTVILLQMIAAARVPFGNAICLVLLIMQIINVTDTAATNRFDR